MQTVVAHRAEERDHGDVLSILLAARDADTGAAMSDDQIHDEIVTIMVAGIEATGAMLAWIFHELATHPAIEHRIRDEVDQVLPAGPAAYEHLAELSYTRGFITEVLRLYAPWQIMRGALAPVEIGGYRLDPGAQILFSPYLLHRDPDVFPDPERLDPARWTEERGRQVPRTALLTFGAGNRQCAGDWFAWTEMTIILAAAVRHWQLRPAPAFQVHPVVGAVLHPNGLPMVPTPPLAVTGL